MTHFIPIGFLMNEEKAIYLAIIQKSAERAARSSGFCKWGAFVIFLAIYLLFFLSVFSSYSLGIVGIPPLIFLWGLEAYFLRKEYALQRIFINVFPKEEKYFDIIPSEFTDFEKANRIRKNIVVRFINDLKFVLEASECSPSIEWIKWAKSITWSYLPLIFSVIFTSIVSGVNIG